MFKNLLIINIAPAKTLKNQGGMNIQEITIVSNYKVVINDQSSFSSAYDYFIDPKCDLIVNVAFTGFIRQKENLWLEEK